MKDYYHRKGVRQAIIDFVYSGSSDPLREGAFYNSEVDGIQRHPPGEDGDSVLVIDSEEAFARARRAGAMAFYLSYWRYFDPSRASGVRGRDLVWSIKADEGGLSAAERATTLFLGALEEEGFSSPLVKYSGELGFDVLIPLEDVQAGAPNNSDFLSKVQSDLTDRASDYVKAQSSFEIGDDNSSLKFTGGPGTCLLSELRWRRGLLLAPMSLHPSSGLVSVPLSPDEVSEFSPVEASPEKVHPREWFIPQTLPRDQTGALVQRSPKGIPLRA